MRVLVTVRGSECGVGACWVVLVGGCACLCVSACAHAVALACKAMLACKCLHGLMLVQPLPPYFCAIAAPYKLPHLITAPYGLLHLMRCCCTQRPHET